MEAWKIWAHLLQQETKVIDDQDVCLDAMPGVLFLLSVLLHMGIHHAVDVIDLLLCSGVDLLALEVYLLGLLLKLLVGWVILVS